MKYSTIALLIISLLITGFKSKENADIKDQEPKVVTISIEIDAGTSKIWDIITNKDYAKILGNIFVKNGFVQSEWQLNSKVDFIYEPDYIVYSGTITKLIEEELIQIDYSINGLEYVEKFSIENDDSSTKLSIVISPYGNDFNQQKVMWQNWLLKVKELSEQQ
ncbi:hypothetical protein ACFSQJ_03820 [Croceitalea marina]|uniref:DUF4468 domain-containing protein n=1 Tax=Croceitalea marina TaxID=1775166 RepID=A0ABW5MTC9_9FLAO